MKTGIKPYIISNLVKIAMDKVAIMASKREPMLRPMSPGTPTPSYLQNPISESDFNAASVRDPNVAYPQSPEELFPNGEGQPPVRNEGGTYGQPGEGARFDPTFQGAPSQPRPDRLLKSNPAQSQSSEYNGDAVRGGASRGGPQRTGTVLPGYNEDDLSGFGGDVSNPTRMRESGPMSTQHAMRSRADELPRGPQRIGTVLPGYNENDLSGFGEDVSNPTRMRESGPMSTQHAMRSRADELPLPSSSGDSSFPRTVYEGTSTEDYRNHPELYKELLPVGEPPQQQSAQSNVAGPNNAVYNPSIGSLHDSYINENIAGNTTTSNMDPPAGSGVPAPYADYNKDRRYADGLPYPAPMGGPSMATPPRYNENPSGNYPRDPNLGGAQIPASAVPSSAPQKVPNSGVGAAAPTTGTRPQQNTQRPLVVRRGLFGRPRVVAQAQSPHRCRLFGRRRIAR